MVSMLASASVEGYALVHLSKSRGLKARPLAIVGYGDEDESDGVTDGKTGDKTGETP